MIKLFLKINPCPEYIYEMVAVIPYLLPRYEGVIVGAPSPANLNSYKSLQFNLDLTTSPCDLHGKMIQRFSYKFFSFAFTAHTNSTQCILRFWKEEPKPSLNKWWSLPKYTERDLYKMLIIPYKKILRSTQPIENTKYAKVYGNWKLDEELKIT